MKLKKYLIIILNQISKIFFDTNYNGPTAFLQKSLKLNEDNYVIQCKIKNLIDIGEKELLLTYLFF